MAFQSNLIRRKFIASKTGSISMQWTRKKKRSVLHKSMEKEMSNWRTNIVNYFGMRLYLAKDFCSCSEWYTEWEPEWKE